MAYIPNSYKGTPESYHDTQIERYTKELQRANYEMEQAKTREDKTYWNSKVKEYRKMVDRHTGDRVAARKVSFGEKAYVLEAIDVGDKGLSVPELKKALEKEGAKITATKESRADLGRGNSGRAVYLTILYGSIRNTVAHGIATRLGWYPALMNESDAKGL